MRHIELMLKFTRCFGVKITVVNITEGSLIHSCATSGLTVVNITEASFYWASGVNFISNHPPKRTPTFKTFRAICRLLKDCSLLGCLAHSI